MVQSIIRQELNKIASELQWANQNRDPSEGSSGHFRRITSMPLDPASPDCSARLNQFSAASLPAARESSPANVPGRLL